MSESAGFAALAIYVTENIIPNKRIDEGTKKIQSSSDGEDRTKSGLSTSQGGRKGNGKGKGKGWLCGFPKLAPQFDGLNSFETFIST